MEEVVRHHTDWVFITLLFSSGLLLWTKFSFPRRFAELASLSRQFVKPLDPSYEKSKTGFFEFITTFNYVFLLALLLMKGSYMLLGRSRSPEDWLTFLQLALVLGFYLGFRNLAIKLVARIFDLDRLGDWWMEYLNLYRVSSGIWLMPIMFLAFFTQYGQGFFLGLALAYLLYFYTKVTLKAMVEISGQGRISFLRIILYLCGLELAPLTWVLVWFFQV